MLKKKKVNEVMTKKVFTTKPDEKVVFAFEKLMKHKITTLPVLDSNKKMVEIVTASDLEYNIVLDNYKLGTKVFSLMVKNVASCKI